MLQAAQQLARAAITGVDSVVRAGARGLWGVFVAYPMRHLYIQGPAVLGFHEGAPVADICSRITNVASEFWDSGSDAVREQCERAIDARVHSIAVLMLVTGYFYACFALFRQVARLAVFIFSRPLVRTTSPPALSPDQAPAPELKKHNQ